MITPLSSKGRRLLEAIVEYAKHGPVDYQRPETYPTYGNLYRAVVSNAPAVVIRPITLAPGTLQRRAHERRTEGRYGF